MIQISFSSRKPGRCVEYFSLELFLNLVFEALTFLSICHMVVLVGYSPKITSQSHLFLRVDKHTCCLYCSSSHATAHSLTGFSSPRSFVRLPSPFVQYQCHPLGTYARTGAISISLGEADDAMWVAVVPAVATPIRPAAPLGGAYVASIRPMGVGLSNQGQRMCV